MKSLGQTNYFFNSMTNIKNFDQKFMLVKHRQNII